MLVGLTLGLSFGGGLLINEVRRGHIKGKDVFMTLAFLSLCHSLIEDTLLIMLLGADLTTILLGRLVFTLLIVLGLIRLLNWLPDNKKHYLYR